MSFDIDANGILNVTAKDKDTGKEQKVTISGSTSLDKAEVERMVNEAQAHAEEDRKRREEIDLRNRADSLAYQVERTLSDMGDKVPVHEKARAEQLITDTRAAIKDNTPVARIQTLISDLEQMIHMLNTTASQAAYGKRNGAQTGHAGNGNGSKEDVIDAEYREK